MRLKMSLSILLAAAGTASAAVKTKVIPYEHDGEKLEGFLAYDDSVGGKRPGILVVHEWWGLNDHAKDYAKKLAGLGYVAFCPDMYGKGKVTTHPDKAREWAGAVRKNKASFRGRGIKGLQILKQQPNVDTKKLAAIGFCFGGTTVLELAYAGTDLDAVASFHGGLTVPTPQEAKAIKATVLICHGAKDAFIPEKTCGAVREAFDANQVDYAFVYYGGATHSFTVPTAGQNGMPVKYSPTADKRSFRHMRMLFEEVFADAK